MRQCLVTAWPPWPWHLEVERRRQVRLRWPVAGSGDRERLLAPAAVMQLDGDRQRSDGCALDVARTHANAKTQFSASQCCDLFRLPFFVLFNGAYNPPCPLTLRRARLKRENVSCVAWLRNRWAAPCGRHAWLAAAKRCLAFDLRAMCFRLTRVLIGFYW